MERSEIESWLRDHPHASQTQPRELLDRCEEEVRDHARHDAWLQARDVAESSLRRFERVFGLPASDAFVAREVCHEIARELKRHEPHPDEQSTARWVGRALVATLDDEARGMLREWVYELAEQEEHEAWLRIVEFADHLGRTLIRDAGMTADLDWDLERSYPRVAARVARMMIREFELRAAMIPLESYEGSVH